MIFLSYLLFFLATTLQIYAEKHFKFLDKNSFNDDSNDVNLSFEEIVITKG